MDPLGAVALGFAGDVGSGLLSHSLASRRQKQAQGFESDMFRNRYQIQVADLKAAGLNPMLAYMQGPGGAPSSSAAGASSGTMGSDAVTAANSTKVASAQAALLTSQKENTDADTIVKGATALQLAASTRLTSKQAEIKGPMASIMGALENIVRPFLQSSAAGAAKRAAEAGKLLKPPKLPYQRKRPTKSFTEAWKSQWPFNKLF